MTETLAWWDQPLSDEARLAVVIIGSLMCLAGILYANAPLLFSAKKGLAKYHDLLDSFEQAGLQVINPQALLELFSAHQYVQQPELLLAMFGSEFEQEGQWLFFSHQVINFDFEVIDDEESYLDVFNSLTRLLAVKPEPFFASWADSTLHYQMGDISRSLKPVFDADWADETVVHQIVSDVQALLPYGYKVWVNDNGQATVFVLMNESQKQSFCQKTAITLTEFSYSN